MSNRKPAEPKEEVRFSGVSIFSLAERWIDALTAWKIRQHTEVPTDQDVSTIRSLLMA